MTSLSSVTVTCKQWPLWVRNCDEKLQATDWLEGLQYFLSNIGEAVAHVET